MKKISQILEGRTHKYDLSFSIKLLEEAMDKIKKVRKEISSKEDLDVKDLEEGWNLIDKYYGNIVRGEIYKRGNGGQFIPNTSAQFPKKGDT
jgi:hypothetical protein